MLNRIMDTIKNGTDSIVRFIVMTVGAMLSIVMLCTLAACLEVIYIQSGIISVMITVLIGAIMMVIGAMIIRNEFKEDEESEEED